MVQTAWAAIHSEGRLEMQIIATAFVTFVVTALWHSWATKKVRKNQQIMVGSLLSELDEMAKQLGHSGLHAYFVHVKGEQYANTAMTNINSFAASFTYRDSG